MINSRVSSGAQKDINFARSCRYHFINFASNKSLRASSSVGKCHSFVEVQLSRQKRIVFSFQTKRLQDFAPKKNAMNELALFLSLTPGPSSLMCTTILMQSVRGIEAPPTPPAKQCALRVSVSNAMHFLLSFLRMSLGGGHSGVLCFPLLPLSMPGFHQKKAASRGNKRGRGDFPFASSKAEQ